MSGFLWLFSQAPSEPSTRGWEANANHYTPLPLGTLHPAHSLPSLGTVGIPISSHWVPDKSLLRVQPNPICRWADEEEAHEDNSFLSLESLAKSIQ